MKTFKHFIEELNTESLAQIDEVGYQYATRDAAASSAGGRPRPVTTIDTTLSPKPDHPGTKGDKIRAQNHFKAREPEAYARGQKAMNRPLTTQDIERTPEGRAGTVATGRPFFSAVKTRNQIKADPIFAKPGSPADIKNQAFLRSLSAQRPKLSENLNEFTTIPGRTDNLNRSLDAANVSGATKIGKKVDGIVAGVTALGKMKGGSPEQREKVFDSSYKSGKETGSTGRALGDIAKIGNVARRSGLLGKSPYSLPMGEPDKKDFVKTLSKNVNNSGNSKNISGIKAQNNPTNVKSNDQR